VLLPGEGFVEYLLAHEQGLSDSIPALEPLPWQDVLFDYQHGRRVITDAMLAALLDTDPPEREPGPALLDRGTCWIRVRTLTRYRQQLRTSSPWMFGPANLLEPFVGDPERWLAVEAWEQNTLLPGGNGRGFPVYPDVSLVPRDRPWDFRAAAQLYPNPDCRSGRAFGDGHGFCNLSRCQFPAGHSVALACQSSELIMSAGVRLALLTLAYLTQAPEYLVEVTPANTEGRKRWTAGKDKKPWTRSLPHIILLDPTRAREYGHPDGTGPTSAGHHATPRAHQRRGHWATLRHERFSRNPDGTPRRVFVRQAWVGAHEWTAEGQRYRVLEPSARRERVPEDPALSTTT
jgi:hypothetical protein